MSHCTGLPYHNIQHTLDVYNHVKKIGEYENLTNRELETVLIAALFHDTGMANRFKGHEAVSISYAIVFLEKQGIAADHIADIANCIKATNMPQQPESLLDQILCDADLFHLGTKHYFQKSRLLREEWSTCLHYHYSDEQWCELNINFLMGHTYHTAYGKELLKPVKQKNIKLLESFMVNT